MYTGLESGIISETVLNRYVVTTGD